MNEILVDIWGPNIPGNKVGPAFHVHKAGCKDVTRRPYKGMVEKGWHMLATSQRVVVETIYPPDEFDYEPAEYQQYADDVKFFPCVKLGE